MNQETKMRDALEKAAKHLRIFESTSGYRAGEQELLKEIKDLLTEIPAKTVSEK